MYSGIIDKKIIQKTEIMNILERESMILYHGSKEIVEFPEIRRAKFNKDFYFGFYYCLPQRKGT